MAPSRPTPGPKFLSRRKAKNGKCRRYCSPAITKKLMSGEAKRNKKKEQEGILLGLNSAFPISDEERDECYRLEERSFGCYFPVFGGKHLPKKVSRCQPSPANCCNAHLLIHFLNPPDIQDSGRIIIPAYKIVN